MLKTKLGLSFFQILLSKFNKVVLFIDKNSINNCIIGNYLFKQLSLCTHSNLYMRPSGFCDLPGALQILIHKRFMAIICVVVSNQSSFRNHKIKKKELFLFTFHLEDVSVQPSQIRNEDC